ncbi:hypothetical protein V6Z05_18175 [Leptospira venezuelensis]|uniref:LA_3334 family protein n=2 Tax=Leptospira venezuelensis TaxID=1958811 RepID=UPI000A3B4CFB|nr:hypothetical protein [Leptospira venezuelensis]
MKRLIIIVTIFIPLSFLSSMELILKTGEVFICDYISETEKDLTLQWKNDRYVVPKSEIQSVNLKISGKHISFKYRNFKMKDNSTIRGLIAEEDANTYTVKTDIGFLTLEKSKISSSEPAGEEIKFDANYLQTDATANKSFIGIGALALVNGESIGGKNPYSFGGSWAAEPHSFKLNTRWLVGYRGEYLISNRPDSNYSFFNNFLYAKYDYKKSEILDFYAIVGGGLSYDQFTGKGVTRAGVNPALNFEAGWQGLKYDNFQLRVGWYTTHIQERHYSFDMTGLQIMAGFRI